MAICFRDNRIEFVNILMDWDGFDPAAHRVALTVDTVPVFRPQVVEGGGGTVSVRDDFYFLEKIIVNFATKAIGIKILNQDGTVELCQEQILFHHSFFAGVLDVSASPYVPPFLHEAEYTKPAFLAVFTHVYNDGDKLKVWENHYTKLTDPSHLYVIDHGSDVPAEHFLRGSTNVVRIPRGSVHHVNIARFCEFFQRFLLSQYQWVIHTDSDELIVHRRGNGALLERLRVSPPGIIRPRGFEIIQNCDSEPPLNHTLPITLQRKHIKYSVSYSKPAIAAIPVSWGPGFHFALNADMAEEEDIWMMHFAFADARLTMETNRRWKQSQLSRMDEHYTPQVHRPDTMEGVAELYRRMLEDGSELMPDWMLGAF